MLTKDRLTVLRMILVMTLFFAMLYSFGRQGRSITVDRLSKSEIWTVFVQKEDSAIVIGDNGDERFVKGKPNLPPHFVIWNGKVVPVTKPKTEEATPTGGQR